MSRRYCCARRDLLSVWVEPRLLQLLVQSGPPENRRELLDEILGVPGPRLVPLKSSNLDFALDREDTPIFSTLDVRPSFAVPAVPFRLSGVILWGRVCFSSE